MVATTYAFFQALLVWVFLHPIHVSVTEINYDEKDKALEIMMRVFIDDLELSMRNRLNEPELDITSPQGKTLDEMMSSYMKEKFWIRLDKRQTEVKYLGHEREGDVFIFYIEVPKVKKWTTIEIGNDILTETHEDQSNLVHVTVSGKVKSLRLTKNNSRGSLTF